MDSSPIEANRLELVLSKKEMDNIEYDYVQVFPVGRSSKIFSLKIVSTVVNNYRYEFYSYSRHTVLFFWTLKSELKF